MEQKFVNKIKTKDGIEYDIRDARVEALETEMSGKASQEDVAAAKSYIAGNSLVIPEQPAPEPVITIDGVAYFHKQEFDLEVILGTSNVNYEALTGSTEVDVLNDTYLTHLYGPTVGLMSPAGYTTQWTFYLTGSSANFTSRAFTVVDTRAEVTDNTKICLPTCSAYYGFLSEDGKTFISYYNLKGDGAPAYVDSIKQGNAVIPFGIRSGSATLGQVLTADGSGGVAFANPAGGGTRLYEHVITLSDSTDFPSNSTNLKIISNFSTPITIENIGSIVYNGTTNAMAQGIVSVYQANAPTTSLIAYMGFRKNQGHVITVIKLVSSEGSLVLQEKDYDLMYSTDTVTEL